MRGEAFAISSVLLPALVLVLYHANFLVYVWKKKKKRYDGGRFSLRELFRGKQKSWRG